jgi:hypothetical protein
MVLKNDLIAVGKAITKAKTIVKEVDDKTANKKYHVMNNELYDRLDLLELTLDKILITT